MVHMSPGGERAKESESRLRKPYLGKAIAHMEESGMFYRPNLIASRYCHGRIPKFSWTDGGSGSATDEEFITARQYRQDGYTLRQVHACCSYPGSGTQ